MPNSPFNALERILTIRLDNIGDVVMTGPALRALRQAAPQAQITLMASPAGSQVAPLLPWVDDVITWRAVWQNIDKEVPLEPEKEWALVQLLAERHFDAAFIFTSFSQSPWPPAYACYLAGIPLRVGQSKEFGGGLLSHSIKPLPDQVYQVERNLHLLRSVDLPVRSDELELQVRPDDQHSADALLAQAGIGPGQPFITLAPGASAAARRYPEERFAEAAARLMHETGLAIVLIGSQREQGKFPRLETAAASQPAAAPVGQQVRVEPAPRLVSLIGQTSVPEMAAVIQRSALLIGNNSGSMHIAAAFNRPMVILFAGTELFEQWVPRRENALMLNQPTACAPCHGFQCPYQLECLDISAEALAASALQQLKTYAFPAPDRSDSLAGSLRR